MYIFELFLYFMAGLFVSYGLICQTKGILKKGIHKKSNLIVMGVFYKLSGFLILAGVLFQFKMAGLGPGLLCFFISFIGLVLYRLLIKNEGP